MAAYRRIYDSRHLQATAQNRDLLRNPTLGNRVWATFLLVFSYNRRKRFPFNPVHFDQSCDCSIG